MNRATAGIDGARRLDALERKCRRLAWTSAALAAAWLLPLAAQLASEAKAQPQAAAAPLTVRELVIVDGNGTPRVRIAEPLPDPIMLGKRFKRGGAVSGILIYDAEGNERGGYVTGDDDRSAALTLDEINRAAVHLGVGDRGESHLMLSNGQGELAAMGVLPTGGYLRLELDGQATAALPAAPAGEKR